MKEIKQQTVYLERENKLLPPYKTEGYFFNKEKLNKYTANIIKSALETAAEKADTKEYDEYQYGGGYKTKLEIDKQSILNVFEEVYQKLKV